MTAEEVLDTCWESPGVMMPGHYCVLDRRSMSIVIAIRGTLSLADTLTDLTATVAPFVVPSTIAAPAGVLDAVVVFSACA